MKQAIIIDVENNSPERFPGRDQRHYVKNLQQSGRPIPVNFVFTPFQRDQREELEEAMVELAERGGGEILLGGLLKVCTQYNHHKTDPNHEGVCTAWFSRNLSKEAQLENMLKGLDFIEKTTGIRPRKYVPPQHLYDSNTIQAAKEAGFDGIVTQAMFQGLYPCMQDGLKIIPSGSMKRGMTRSPVVHVYHDLIWPVEGEYERIIDDAIPLDSVPTLPRASKHRMNQPFLRLSKQVRDVRRILHWYLSREKPDWKNSNQVYLDRSMRIRHQLKRLEGN